MVVFAELKNLSVKEKLLAGSLFALLIFLGGAVAPQKALAYVNNPSVPDTYEAQVEAACPPGHYDAGQTIGKLYFEPSTVTTSDGTASTGAYAFAFMCSNGNYNQVRNIQIFITSTSRYAGNGNVSFPNTSFYPSNIPINDYDHATNPYARTANFNNLSNGSNCWTVYYDMIAQYGSSSSNLPGVGASNMCINVTLASDNGHCVITSYPGTVNAGQSFTAYFEVHNTGTQHWPTRGTNLPSSQQGSHPNRYKLGSDAPYDNNRWGPTRLELPGETSGFGPLIYSGTYWFNVGFNFTAPSTGGWHTFAWRVLSEGVRNLNGCSVSIYVNPPVTPSLSVTPTCSGSNSVANVSWNRDTGGGDYWLLLGYGSHGYGGWARNYGNGSTSAQVPSGVDGAGSSLDQNRSNYWVLLRFNRTGQEVYYDFAAAPCTRPTVDTWCAGSQSGAFLYIQQDAGGGSYYVLLGYGAHSYGGWANTFPNSFTNPQLPRDVGYGPSFDTSRSDWWVMLRYTRTGQEFYVDFAPERCQTLTADPAVCSSGVPTTTIRWTGINPYFDGGRGQWGVWVDISLNGSFNPLSNKFVPTVSSSGSTTVPNGFGFASPPLNDVGNLYSNRDYYFRVFNGGHVTSSVPFRTPNCSFLSASSTCDASGNLTAYVNWNNVNPAPVGPGGAMGVWVDISTNSSMLTYSNKFIPTSSVNGWDPSIPSGYSPSFTLQEGVRYYWRLYNGGHVPPNDSTGRWPSFTGGKCPPVLDPVTSSCDSGSYEVTLRWTGWPIDGNNDVVIDDGRYAFYVQIVHVTTSSGIPFHKQFTKVYYVPGDGRNTYSDTAPGSPNQYLFAYSEPLTFIPGQTYYAQISTYGGTATSPTFVASGCQSPYLRVYGGDVLAGAAIDRPVCTVNPSAQIRTFNRGPSQGYGAGAGTQLAAHATGAITEFTSAAMRSPLTSPVPNPPRGLSFSNTIGTYGGSFGGSAPCLPDYWANANNIQSSYSIGPGVRTIPRGSRQVVYVDSSSDVNIRGNIEFADVGLWSSMSDIPAFYLIVRGSNIMIENVVSRIDGVFIALPDEFGNGGKIYTCARDGGIAVEANRILEVCNNKLTINGAFVAKQVKFLRANNSVTEATPYELRGSPTIAEVFNYSPENWLVTPDISPPKPDELDSLTTLSPIL